LPHRKTESGCEYRHQFEMKVASKPLNFFVISINEFTARFGMLAPSESLSDCPDATTNAVAGFEHAHGRPVSKQLNGG
jgi:hypothetical protein